MRIAVFLVFILSSSVTVFGQLNIIPIEHESENLRVLNTDSIYTLELPFWDDFSTSFLVPDTMLWSTGEDVFVNETIAKNPPTYRSATFDGLKQNGLAYGISSDSENAITDVLESHYIDLSQISDENKNSVFLSFFWQAGGNGELPDEKDSLRLMFYTSERQYETVWYQIGGQENNHDRFRQVIVPVDDSTYFHDEFRLRFESVTSQKGPFDTWHLDYIYLNKNRNEGDTTHFDRGLTGHVSNLFGKYYEVPANHFFNATDLSLNTQTISTYNLDNLEHPIEYFYYELKNLTTDEEYSSTQSSNVLMPAFAYQTVAGADLNNFSVPSGSLDSVVLQTTFYEYTNDKNLFEEVIGSDTIFSSIDLKVNDTIRTQYLLDDYYAYDDGTAEFAVGLNVYQGEVSVRYAVIHPDTLTHVDLYFPNIAPSSDGKNIVVKIYQNLNRNSKAISSVSHTIQSPTSRDEFTRIALLKSVYVSDTIYIGYQQSTEDFIGIGFDRTNADATSELFTKVSDTWEQNTSLSGAMMIRPVFGQDSTFILHHPEETSNYRIYPNPSEGWVKVNQPHQSLKILSLSGQLLYDSPKRNTYDLSFLKRGVYLIQIESDESVHTQKLIIK